MRVNGSLGRYILAVIFVAGTVASFFNSTSYAAPIGVRSLTLQDTPGGDGGSKPGGTVRHLFTFTLPSNLSIGSIKFEYCTLASVQACVTPTGLVTTGATLGAQTGATGFTMVNTTNGAPYLTRTAAVSTGDVTYRLDGVVNPTTANYTFFTRISTYASTDTTGSAIDTGSVAASTATPIVLTGVMPESLIFCTGATILTTAGIPDCTTASSGAVDFPMLFSPTATAFTTSQMAASTNAVSGYSISVTGPTLTAGGNTIPAMTTSTTSVTGTGQFGINLVANTAPTVGAAIAPAADGTTLKGQAAVGYDTADNFKFLTTGDVVANSQNGGAGATNAQIFTSSYIVNVPGNQPAGTYVSTLTYICTPSF